MADYREDIQNAVDRLPTTMGTKKALGNLTSHLWEGETVRLISAGTYNARNGLLVLTDSRLIFVREGMMSSSTEDFPLDKISSIESKQGMLMGSLTVFASGNKSEIKNVEKGLAKEMADLVRSYSVVPSTASAQVATVTESPIELIKALAELRDAGVLTEEEFAAKKAELMDQI